MVVHLPCIGQGRSHLEEEFDILGNLLIQLHDKIDTTLVSVS